MSFRPNDITMFRFMNNPVECDHRTRAVLTNAAEHGVYTPMYATLCSAMSETCLRFTLKARDAVSLAWGPSHHRPRAAHLRGYAYGSLLHGVTHTNMREEIERQVGKTIDPNPISSLLVATATRALGIIEIVAFMRATGHLIPDYLFSALELIMISHGQIKFSPNQMATLALRFHSAPPIKFPWLGVSALNQPHDPVHLLEWTISMIVQHMENECAFDSNLYMNYPQSIQRCLVPRISINGCAMVADTVNRFQEISRAIKDGNVDIALARSLIRR